VPKLRVRLPIEIEVTPEELDALSAVGDAIVKAKDSGLAEAISKAITKTAAAARSVTRARRSR
jgi:hypothetical protein